MPVTKEDNVHSGLTTISGDSWPYFLLNAVVKAMDSCYSKANYEGLRTVFECLTGCPPLTVRFEDKPKDLDNEFLVGEALDEFRKNKVLVIDD